SMPFVLMAMCRLPIADGRLSMDSLRLKVKRIRQSAIGNRQCFSFLQQLCRDHELLDFRGAFVNPQRTNVAIKPLHDVAPHKPGTALDLYRAVDDSSCGFRGK